MSLKCVVVGDVLAGKSELCSMYQPNKNPIVIEGVAQKLELADETGHEEYDRIRPLLYHNADVFIICFSVIIPSTEENVENKWVKEIQKHAPSTPYILVGTQIEYREDSSKKGFTHKHGAQVAKKIKALKYLECSVNKSIGLKEIFESATYIAAEADEETAKKKKRCEIL